MKNTAVKFFLIVFFVFAALWTKDLYEFSLLIKYPEKPFDIQSEVPVDMIAVLTGGQGRFRSGLDLLKKYPRAVLLVSGTESYVTLDDVLKANNVLDLSPSLRSQIWLGKFSKNTLENAIELREVAEQTNSKNILIVTSSYHARRALEFIKKEIDRSKRRDIAVYYHPVESPNFPQTGWWRRWIGWRIFFSEYFKSSRFWPSRVDEQN